LYGWLAGSPAIIKNTPSNGKFRPAGLLPEGGRCQNPVLEITLGHPQGACSFIPDFSHFFGTEAAVLQQQVKGIINVIRKEDPPSILSLALVE
jgi:hypothetical protein